VVTSKASQPAHQAASGRRDAGAPPAWTRDHGGLAQQKAQFATNRVHHRFQRVIGSLAKPGSQGVEAPPAAPIARDSSSSRPPVAWHLRPRLDPRNARLSASATQGRPDAGWPRRWPQSRNRRNRRLAIRGRARATAGHSAGGPRRPAPDLSGRRRSHDRPWRSDEPPNRKKKTLPKRRPPPLFFGIRPKRSAAVSSRRRPWWLAPTRVNAAQAPSGCGVLCRANGRDSRR